MALIKAKNVIWNDYSTKNIKEIRSFIFLDLKIKFDHKDELIHTLIAYFHFDIFNDPFGLK